MSIQTLIDRFKSRQKEVLKMLAICGMFALLIFLRFHFFPEKRHPRIHPDTVPTQTVPTDSDQTNQ